MDIIDSSCKFGTRLQPLPPATQTTVSCPTPKTNNHRYSWTQENIRLFMLYQFISVLQFMHNIISGLWLNVAWCVGWFVTGQQLLPTDHWYSWGIQHDGHLNINSFSGKFSFSFFHCYCFTSSLTLLIHWCKANSASMQHKHHNLHSGIIALFPGVDNILYHKQYIFSSSQVHDLFSNWKWMESMI